MELRNARKSEKREDSCDNSDESYSFIQQYFNIHYPTTLMLKNTIITYFVNSRFIHQYVNGLDNFIIYNPIGAEHEIQR